MGAGSRAGSVSRRASARWVAVLAIAVAGCTPGHGGWSTRALGERHPAIETHAGQRLGDAAPYFVPVEGGLLLFLCHWDPNRPVSYSLPDDATPEEEAILEGAIAAWESGGLGLEFERVGSPQGASLEIAFVSSKDATTPSGTANTATDCAAVLGPGVSRHSDIVPARIVRARIRMRRSNHDFRGREIQLEPAELAGTALHELGHALGFPTHVIDDSSIMSRSVDRVRSFGRERLRDEPLDDPTLRALYAVPSGTVVGFLPLTSELLGPLLDLRGQATRREWAGPYVRVGDRSARIWWWDAQDRAMGYRIQGSARDWSRTFVALPTVALAQEE